MGTRSVSRGQNGRGVAVTTPPPFLAPRLMSAAVLLPPLWAAMACRKMKFNSAVVFPTAASAVRC